MTSRKKPLTPEQLLTINNEQLRREAELPRIKFSQAVEDLKNYVEAAQTSDYLVTGFEKSPKKNPFRKRRNCPIL